MTNKQPQTVSIDGIDYNVDDLSDQTKILVDHLADLDRKLASIAFQRDQLQVGRNAFFGMLKESLDKKEEDDS